MQFPKDIQDCMRDCLLAIFWPREDIISFFENNGCSSRDLNIVYDYKEKGFNRAQIINLVFDRLQKRDDFGLGQFRSILNSLVKWNHFDPYYFKNLKKLDQNEAIKKLNHLKQLQEIRDAEQKKRRNIQKQKENNVKKSIKLLDEIREDFLYLYQGKNHLGENIALQKRGYLFEKLLQNLFRYENLSVTESFKINGEQIDGALKFEGEHYIIEAKWQDNQIASDSLYQFAYKVEGKLYGRGIFISINGYTHESLIALQKGKALNTVLFDGADISLIIEGIYSFSEILDMKLKAAQTKGLIYIDISTMKSKVKAIGMI